MYRKAAVLVACIQITALAKASADMPEIGQFETEYLRTVDDGDIKGQLEMVSRDPAVHSIINGEVWRGWDAIWSQAEAFAPMAKKVRSVVDKIDVIPLGTDAALVVMVLHSVKRDAADTSVPDMSGVLTHVLKKTPEGWRMLQEHFSNKLTPEFIAFLSAMAQAQQKAAANEQGSSR